MYGKIFDSIYDGTLRANWQGLVTFQQLIILADKDGVLDMTPHAIHGRTGIPLEIIEAGLDHLSKPDPYSRSSAEEGRRIILLDENRPWGWRLVNHDYYNRLRSAEEKREADRERISEKRKSTKSTSSLSVAECRGESHGVAKVAPVAVAVDVSVTTDTASKPTPGAKAPLRGFDVFWLSYPNKKNKGKAESIWKRIKPNAQLHEAILHGVERAKTSEQWSKDGGKFIPHPATWLNARGWEDEHTTTTNQQVKLPKAFPQQ